MIDVLWLTFPQPESFNIKKASTILGYKPYSGREILMEKHEEIWINHLLNQQPIDWNEVYQNYDFALELPSILYYKKLLAINPQLKIILGDIDSRTAYSRFIRYENLIRYISPWMSVFKRSRRLKKMLNHASFLLLKGDKSSLNIMTQHATFKQEVISYVPSHRLLIFNSNDGWQPLCDFLNKPIPSEPFPIAFDENQLNKSSRNTSFSFIRRDAVPFILYFLTLIGLFVYLLFFYN